MNLDDQKKLKFDRRLDQRRGWLAPGELEAHLEGLADVADKVHDGTEEEQPPAEAPAAAPTPPPAAPEGGFGGSSI